MSSYDCVVQYLNHLFKHIEQNQSSRRGPANLENIIESGLVSTTYNGMNIYFTTNNTI